jgi:hypothetical protein
MKWIKNENASAGSEFVQGNSPIKDTANSK